MQSNGETHSRAEPAQADEEIEPRRAEGEDEQQHTVAPAESEPQGDEAQVQLTEFVKALGLNEVLQAWFVKGASTKRWDLLARFALGAGCLFSITYLAANQSHVDGSAGAIIGAIAGYVLGQHSS